MDQVRFDHLGFMGNPDIRTPHLDRLAGRGVVFNRAYVNNPLCMPARATLFTGLTPRGHGVRTNGIPLRKDIPTLPDALRRAGYLTHTVGKLHLSTMGVVEGMNPEELDPEEYPEMGALWRMRKITRLPSPYYGMESADYVGGHVFKAYGNYSHWLENNHPEAFERLNPGHVENISLGAPQVHKFSIPQDCHYTRWIGDKTVEFLERVPESGRPFFLWCSFPDPHHPYAVPEPWSEMYDPEKITCRPRRRDDELDSLPPFYKSAYLRDDTLLSGLMGKAAVTDLELRKMVAVTYGMISFMDEQIGRIMAALRESGLEKNTAIVFLSDHGDMMGDHWMVRKGPFHFDGLLRIPFVWCWPDRIPAGRRTEGLASHIDFAPTILDLCGVPVPEGNTPPEAVASRESVPWPGRSLLPQIMGSEEKVNEHVIVENDEDYLGLRLRSYITDRYQLTLYAGQDWGELFDLQKDPDQLHNLWEDEQFSSLKERLKIEFFHRYMLQDSPLPRRLSLG